MLDYHTHAGYTWDAMVTVEDCLAAAKARGLEEICLTNHFEPTHFGSSEKYSIMPRELGEYLDLVRDLGERFGIEARVGLEVEWDKEYEPDIKRYLSEYDFDFVLGSTHGIEDHHVTEKTVLEFFKTRPLTDVLKLYFDKLALAAGSGLFDAMSHLDVVRKFAVSYYGPFDFELYRPFAKKVVAAIADSGAGIEINSSGFRHGLNDFYPCPELLAMCADAGIDVLTVGSDSHSGEHLAYKFDEALAAAKEAGFKKITTFKRRNKRFINI